MIESMTENHSAMMKRCIALAQKAAGRTAPNPLVGCVITQGSEIVGEGFHPKAGEPHAEVFALRAAGDRAKDATAYVSLEPCSHFGRTPPCANALIEAGQAFGSSKRQLLWKVELPHAMPTIMAGVTQCIMLSLLHCQFHQAQIVESSSVCCVKNRSLDSCDSN